MQLKGGRQHTLTWLLIVVSLLTIGGAYALSWYEKDGSTYEAVALPVFVALTTAVAGAAGRNMVNRQ